jgi:hypothetical protein
VNAVDSGRWIQSLFGQKRSFEEAQFHLKIFSEVFAQTQQSVVHQFILCEPTLPRSGVAAYAVTIVATTILGPRKSFSPTCNENMIDTL